MSLIESTEHVAVFIDGQFLMKGLHATCPEELFDFQKIVRKLVSPGRLTRVGYYTAPPPSYLAQDRKDADTRRRNRIRGFPFFDLFVGEMRSRTRRVMPVGGSSLIRATYWEQKGVDVRLAIDMMGKAQSGQYDTAVLVSGDSDFVEMVKYVKEAGKHVISATSPLNHSKGYRPSGKLRQACDGHIWMDGPFLRDCCLAPRRDSSRRLPSGPAGPGPGGGAGAS